MAPRKTTKAKATEEKAPEAKKEEMKYGVEALVEATGLQAASVRVALRDLGVEKAGRSYGWNTKKDFDAVVKGLKERSAKRAVPTGEEAHEKKAPAKKKAAEK